jgi:hypothetical protein
MKTRIALLVFIALIAALPLAAKGIPVGFRVGAEAAFEDEFSRVGLGPLADISLSSKNWDFEAYLQWTPYLLPQGGVGSIYGELDAYYHILIKKNLSLHPALSIAGLSWPGLGNDTLTIEPSIKLDANNAFVKVCVPLRVSPTFAPYAYLEPGVHLWNLTLKLRGAAALDTFDFQYLRWWADYAFGKNDIYAYGVVRGFSAGQTVRYDQYLGFYIGF